MTGTEKPVIRALEKAGCLEILARNHVGRMAYARDNRVEIEPIHYVYSDGWIYGRTSEGKKLEMTGLSWHPVAFEVDEVEGLFQWRSVVVHGGFYTIPYWDTDWEAKEWRHGIELLRTLVPETFQADDPAPTRRIMFRIAVQEITGREALPAD